MVVWGVSCRGVVGRRGGGWAWTGEGGEVGREVGERTSQLEWRSVHLTSVGRGDGGSIPIRHTSELRGRGLAGKGWAVTKLPLSRCEDEAVYTLHYTPALLSTHLSTHAVSCECHNRMLRSLLPLESVLPTCSVNLFRKALFSNGGFTWSQPSL